MKKTLILLSLILTVFALDAVSQTRRTTVRRKAPVVRAKRPMVQKTMTTPPATAAVTTASGLTYLITQHAPEGRQTKAGDTVTVHYTGLLTSGVKFDSSLDRGEPFSFKLGAGQVIKGWDEGIQKLRVGERATLFIPPSIGYGSRGAGGVIPPDAMLIFIVEVVGVK